MKIAVLTSSRADYGIYFPLLNALKNDPFFEMEIIAFGTHLSAFHGYTIQHILNDGFKVKHQIEHILAGDSEGAIATSMGLATMKFAALWEQEKHNYDLVFCLGDRYEMFAAVNASIPFNIPLAHLHGGETTTGAIDNIFRHSISLASRHHFVSTTAYGQRVKELTHTENTTHMVGALSLDNLNLIDFRSPDYFKETYNIDLSIPTILSTVHPETVSPEHNEAYAKVFSETLESLEDFQVVITMPNADTNGNIYREYFYALQKKQPEKIVLVENFGSRNYFSCMKYCAFLLGNTSSGIIEAASLNKYVIDLGSRQNGRVTSENVIHCSFEKADILEAIQLINKRGDFKGDNIYWAGGAVEKIIQTLKEKL